MGDHSSGPWERPSREPSSVVHLPAQAGLLKLLAGVCGGWGEGGADRFLRAARFLSWVNIKIAGPFLNKANKHATADALGMVNSVLNIMKAKSFPKHPLWARCCAWWVSFGNLHDGPRTCGIYLHFLCGSLRLGLFARMQSQTLPFQVC